MPVGDSFFLGNPANAKLHLYVVLSRPDVDAKVLCVSLSSFYPGCPDRACIINPGEFNFPFIRHESFADYGKAKEIDSEILRINTLGRRWTPGDRVPDGLVRAMQEGARRSAFLAVKLRRFLDLF
jgi:hypothetical protein